MQKFKKQYRIESIRLPHYDYAQPGYYFVTICTKNMRHWFGEVVNHKMVLSNVGNIALHCWQQIPNHFSHVELDEYIIMPNHIHGIIQITKYVPPTVETQNFASLRSLKSTRKNQFGPQSKNLASIIRGFKIGVKKYATENQINFSWQPRFYEHVLRTERDIDSVRQYILDNPKNWANDEYNN